MGVILGLVLGRMNPEDRAGVFRRLVPRITFLMTILASVTITSVIELAQRPGYSLFSGAWIIAAIVIVSILTVQGFGLLLPNEIPVFRQLLSDTPDIEKISRLGMRNARLGGVHLV